MSAFFCSLWDSIGFNNLNRNNFWSNKECDEDKRYEQFEIECNQHDGVVVKHVQLQEKLANVIGCVPSGSNNRAYNYASCEPASEGGSKPNADVCLLVHRSEALNGEIATCFTGDSKGIMLSNGTFLSDSNFPYLGFVGSNVVSQYSLASSPLVKNGVSSGYPRSWSVEPIECENFSKQYQFVSFQYPQCVFVNIDDAERMTVTFNKACETPNEFLRANQNGTIISDSGGFTKKPLTTNPSVIPNLTSLTKAALMGAVFVVLLRAIKDGAKALGKSEDDADKLSWCVNVGLSFLTGTWLSAGIGAGVRYTARKLGASENTAQIFGIAASFAASYGKMFTLAGAVANALGGAAANGVYNCCSSFFSSKADRSNEGLLATSIFVNTSRVRQV